VVVRAVGSPRMAPPCDADRDAVASRVDARSDRLAAPRVPAAARPAVPPPAKPTSTAQPSLWEER
jgi:hypothetical protein